MQDFRRQTSTSHTSRRFTRNCTLTRRVGQTEAARLSVWLGFVSPEPVYRLVLTVFAAVLALPATAQTFTTLYAGQTGTTLQASLRSGYTPTTTYSYARARDTLFAYVDDGNRAIITDIYAGRTLAIPAGTDPTIAGCNGDGDNNSSTCNGALNFNTEHAYPQSKGASSGAAQSDMHHLYPARADVNSSRSNFPYGIFSDADTWKYFRDVSTVTCSLGGCPPADAATYSAVSAPYGPGGMTYFYPRASVRGDLARSIFYFYTIYRTQADAADPAFFESMRPTLLLWHKQDPVSVAEQARSTRVKRYQGNDNPFVLDTTLVRRAYDPSYNASLPVELVAFTAATDQASVRLAWTTASETNNVGFVVEQQLPTDWAEVGFVPGHGTTTERHDYTFTVANAAPGRQTFRLRQHDTDGAIHYSAPITVEVPVTTDDLAPDGFALRVTPLPARSSVTITPALPANATGRVEVLDVLGRIMFMTDAALPFVLDVRSWPEGHYIVRLAAETRLYTTPLVVRR